VTNREQLAWAIVAAPAIIAVLVVLAPRRIVTMLAVAGALVTAGLGLLLGVFGLAAVVLRGVWERLGEFAHHQAHASMCWGNAMAA